MDMLCFKPYRKYLLLLPLAVVVILETRIMATPFIVFLMLTTLAPYLFASEDKNSMHRLFALLPISKKDVVVGRYICCIIGATIYIILMTLIQCACSIFTGLLIPYILYSMITCTGLFLLFTAIQFPIFFKVGFIKGKFFALAPTYILFGIIMAIRLFVGVDILSELAFLSAINSTFILIIGIVAITISLGIAVRLYQSRED
jgi:hypothetical protein